MSTTLTDADVDLRIEALNQDRPDSPAARQWLEAQLRHSTLTPAQRQRVQVALVDFLRLHGEEAPWPAPAETRYV